MPADSGSRGRRDNGLTARAFLSVGDVDPRVGEHLLDVLYLNGIAAYLQPSVDYDAVTRAASLPRQPTDRLWADRRRADDARALVAAEAASAGRPPAAGSSGASPATSHPAGSPPPATPPGPPWNGAADALDEGAAWAEIVAFFHQDSTAAVPPWPVSEDADEPRISRRARRHDDGAPTVTPAQEWLTGGPEPEPTGIDPEPAEEEGYVPPPPPPVPRISKHTFGALLAVAFGVFVLALGPRLLGLDPDASLKVGILAVIAGIAYLIWRMRDGPSADERPDDGAVV